MAEIIVTPTQTDLVISIGENTASARSFAQAAEASAATALVAAGPNYASTAAGLAATTLGDTFAVDEGDTIAVYRHDAGPVATFLRRFPQDILASGLQLLSPTFNGPAVGTIAGNASVPWNAIVNSGNINQLYNVEYRASNGTDWTTTGGRLVCRIDATDQTYIEYRTPGAAPGIAFGTNGSVERMRITAGGNVGIGTSNPGFPLSVRANSGSDAIRLIGRSSDEASTLEFSNNAQSAIIAFIRGASGNLIFATGDTERMRLTDAGRLGIGTTAPSEVLHVIGNILASGSITQFSDQRLKEDVATVDKALDKVQNMRGVTYRRKDTGEVGVGVIAQEMLTVLPEVVNTNGDHMAVAYGNIVGVLIEAIKELSAKVEELTHAKIH